MVTIKDLTNDYYDVNGKIIRITDKLWGKHLNKDEYRALKSFIISDNVDKLTFGKYKGVPIYQLKSTEGYKYLNWLIGSTQWKKVPEQTKKIIMSFVEGRTDG